MGRRVIMNDMRIYGNLLLEVRKVAHDDTLSGNLLKDTPTNMESFENPDETVQKDNSLLIEVPEIPEACQPYKKSSSRRYMRWKPADSEKVISHFKSYINDV